METDNLHLIMVITPQGELYYYICGDEDLANLSPYASIYKKNCTTRELWDEQGRERFVTFNSRITQQHFRFNFYKSTVN